VSPDAKKRDDILPEVRKSYREKSQVKSSAMYQQQATLKMRTHQHQVWPTDRNCGSAAACGYKCTVYTLMRDSDVACVGLGAHLEKTRHTCRAYLSYLSSFYAHSTKCTEIKSTAPRFATWLRVCTAKARQFCLAGCRRLGICTLDDDEGACLSAEIDTGCGLGSVVLSVGLVRRKDEPWAA
jgi:hypothetical protein